MALYDFNTRDKVSVMVELKGDEVKLSGGGEVKTISLGKEHFSDMALFLQGLEGPSMTKMDLFFEVQDYTDILKKGWLEKK